MAAAIYNTGDVLLTRLHGEIGQVTEIMRSNIDKLIIRGQKLEELEEKTEMLAREAELFKNKSKKLNRAMKWKNAKFYIVGGIVLVVVASIIICVIVL